MCVCVHLSGSAAHPCRNRGRAVLDRWVCMSLGLSNACPCPGCAAPTRAGNAHVTYAAGYAAGLAAAKKEVGSLGLEEKEKKGGRKGCSWGYFMD